MKTPSKHCLLDVGPHDSVLKITKRLISILFPIAINWDPYDYGRSIVWEREAARDPLDHDSFSFPYIQDELTPRI